MEAQPKKGFSELTNIVESITNNVMILTFNAPQTLNALTAHQLRALKESLEKAELNPEVRAVLLIGKGRAFSVGQNLQEIAESSEGFVEIILKECYEPLIHTIRNIKKPVVAGVNGVAVGAGFSIALACDMILMAESASFHLGFSKIGLIPDAGATHFLVHSLGVHRAASMIYADKPLNSLQAADLGLATEIFPDEHFFASCEKFMQQLQKQSLLAFSAAKELLNLAWYQNRQKQLCSETSHQTKLTGSAFYYEKVHAFLQKSSQSVKQN